MIEKEKKNRAKKGSKRGPLDPSVPLHNTRWEKFVQIIFAGQNTETQGAAYHQAGFSATGMSAEVNAGKLLNKPEVKARLQWLQQDAGDRNGVTVDRLIQEQACIALLDPANMFDDAGNLLPIKQIPESTRRAIAGFDVEVKKTKAMFGDEEKKNIEQTTVVKIKFHTKAPTHDQLAKILGAYKKDNEQGANALAQAAAAAAKALSNQ